MSAVIWFPSKGMVTLCTALPTVVPGATHLFEEPGTLEAAAETAQTWFLAHLR